MPGFTTRSGSSYGYLSSGSIYTGKELLVNNLPKLETGSVIGCGINYLENTLFFTINGKFLENIEIQLSTDFGSEFYATASLLGPETKITFNFGKNDDFVFDLKKFIKE